MGVFRVGIFPGGVFIEPFSGSREREHWERMVNEKHEFASWRAYLKFYAIFFERISGKHACYFTINKLHDNAYQQSCNLTPFLHLF